MVRAATRKDYNSVLVDSSVNGRFWTLADKNESAIRDIRLATGASDLVCQILAARGVSSTEANIHLQPTLRETFPDPSSFIDMDKAATIVLEAILENKRVTVFADYDVDGGASSAILTRYFRAWGQELNLYVPDRLKEGYGPSPETFSKLKNDGAELVITVDCGAAAIEALEEAQRIELPVVVIDHHLMSGAEPPAAALVNPNRPGDNSGQGHLAAAGVVFVFVAALNRLAKTRGIAPESGLPDLMKLLDLCALGTLCDMSPLTGVNRAFVKQGLKILAAGDNTGLRALADVADIGIPSSVYHATFVLGPRLNAGGRVGDPWLAAKLLATDDRAEAIALAERLHQLNDERKAVEASILEQATIQAEKVLSIDPDCGILIASGEGWHPGVIGIVAGRLKDRFQRPSIVIGWGEGLGPVAKGSARSVQGVNIGDAISSAAKAGIVLSGGGHAMAGGLSLLPDQLPAFENWMTKHMAKFVSERAAALEVCVDSVITPSGATVELVNDIASVGPFGVGARQPVFAIMDVEVVDARRIGVNHLRVTVQDAHGRLECVYWRAIGSPAEDLLKRGQKVHLVGNLKLNEWNGRKRVQLDIRDAAQAN